MEKSILLRMDEKLHAELTSFFKESTFTSQTELIRQAIREYLQQQRVEKIIQKHFHAYSGVRPTQAQRAVISDEFLKSKGWK